MFPYLILSEVHFKWCVKEEAPWEHEREGERERNTLMKWWLGIKTRIHNPENDQKVKCSIYQHVITTHVNPNSTTFRRGLFVCEVKKKNTHRLKWSNLSGSFRPYPESNFLRLVLTSAPVSCDSTHTLYRVVPARQAGTGGWLALRGTVKMQQHNSSLRLKRCDSLINTPCRE